MKVRPSVMIQTSYFAKAARLPNAVAISQGIPEWYHGVKYKPLAPSWEIIHIKDPDLYKKRYWQEVLSKLDPKQVATDLDGCILLCHEKDGTHCHRRIVAEWLEASLGIEVPEMYNKMNVMYDREGEYADLGLNLYTGCSHDCCYCYNKREDRRQGPYDEPARGASIHNIRKDLDTLRDAGDKRPVHISFVGDPYDVGRIEGNRPAKGLMQYFSEEAQKAMGNVNYTRRVLDMFRAYDQPFQILTKGGMLAVSDFDLYTPQDKFGVTLTFDNDSDSKKWEPGAALPADRIAALKEAHSQGIHTWVSMEPVIYPEQTLHLIEQTHEFVDFFWIGKLNRKTEATWIRPEEWPNVDWPKFRGEVEELLQKCGKVQGIGYQLKHQLREAI